MARQGNATALRSAGQRVVFIDHQFAGSYGRGEWRYTLGPYRTGSALVISKWARTLIDIETQGCVNDVAYHAGDMGAKIASGSFKTDGMIVMPCRTKTLSSIRSGYSDNLVSRAADVTLKEGRKLVLVPGEAPLGAIHLENRLELSRLGVCIFPPTMPWYHQPKTIEDMTEHVVARVMDQFDLEHRTAWRWQGFRSYNTDWFL